MRTAVLHDTAFCPYDTLRLFADEHRHSPYHSGALASFCGIARAQKQKDDKSDSALDPLQSLYLDCYPSMAEQCLADIIDEAQARWSLHGATIHHRVGEVPVGDTIVLVACLSARRHHAFDACRYMTDMVKVRPPLWKREESVRGEQAWLSASADDTRRAMAWQETRVRHIS